MSATKTPDVGLPATAPTITKEWSQGIGETAVHEWKGEREEIAAEYAAQKALAQAGGNIAQLTYRSADGRATLVARFGRSEGGVQGYPDDVAVVEELYAVDVVKDIREAPYFCTGGTAALTDDQVNVVTRAVDERWTEAEITPYSKTAWASWSAGQKELRYHLSHGGESYWETAYILRRSLYGVKTSEIKASFAGINRVTTADPELTTQMDQLILSLPAGEWLYRPPEAEHLGRGRWRITQEWTWAEKWSKVYGGTWGL